jgi:hypothetical protein
MKKKLLISLLSSVGILVVGVGVAYGAFTFKANQAGFRQGADAQAAKLTMQVEAGMADANSDLLPDDYYNASTSPGGALSFSIKNTNSVPLRVSKIEQVTFTCGANNKQCNLVSSNKNGDGTFNASGGDCSQWVTFVAPTSFDNWPTIAPHSTLQVNGTDNNRLGAGMIHLSNSTAQGCQGATFGLSLNVTAYEATQAPGSPLQP